MSTVNLGYLPIGDIGTCIFLTPAFIALQLLAPFLIFGGAGAHARQLRAFGRPHSGNKKGRRKCRPPPATPQGITHTTVRLANCRCLQTGTSWDGLSLHLPSSWPWPQEPMVRRLTTKPRRGPLREPGDHSRRSAPERRAVGPAAPPPNLFTSRICTVQTLSGTGSIVMDPKSLPEPKSKVALPKDTPPADPLGLRLHSCPHWYQQ